MTKPFNKLEENLDEYEEGDDPQEFLNSRAEFVTQMWKSSGRSQQEFAAVIGFSTAYGQKILTQGFPWGKKESAISEALGLPLGCLSTEEATKEFLDLCPVFCISIDALVHFNSGATREAKVVPRVYILEKIAASDLDEDVCENLTKYFSDPENIMEPDDKAILAELEKLLGLPINAINNPDELMQTKSKASRLGIKTRRIIKNNVKAHMERENLSTVELATRAGILESAVDKLLGDRCQCSMTTIFGIASALSLEPHFLMVSSEEKYSPTSIEHEYQKKEYEDLPLVARTFLSEYLQLIREKIDVNELSEPTGRASSILILTPILHYAIKLIENNSNSMNNNTSMDLAGIMANLERNLRAMN